MTKGSTPRGEDTEKSQDQAYEPYAKELGFLLRDWNDLQLAIQSLFVVVMGTRTFGRQYELLKAAWNAVPIDRHQRAMLKEAARYRYANPYSVSSDARMKLDAEIFEAIEWIIERADILGRHRDDAAHVPLMFFSAAPTVFVAKESSGHPIAKKLQFKDIRAELQYTRQKISTVRKYVLKLTDYLAVPRQVPLPDKPTWPDRPQSSEEVKRLLSEVERLQRRPLRPSLK